MVLLPQDYYREGQGSLMQCVLTPADAYMPLPNEAIAAKVDAQVRHISFSCRQGSTADASNQEHHRPTVVCNDVKRRCSL